MRERFLLDPDLVFLNHGSFGACPREVLDVFHRWQREMERNPVEFLARRSGVLLREARERLADYLGARAEDLLFLANATHGVNLVAHSLDLQAGDEVLTTDHEYGACDQAWRAACTHAGAKYRAVPVPLPFDAASFPERIWSEVTPRTRVLFLSHVTSTTALRLPVEALCRKAREAGILTVLDGAHAPGQMALDLEALGADFYTGNCHKWLCAPKSAAFLHVRPDHQERLAPLVVSWGSCREAVGHAGFEAYTGTTPLERPHQWQGTRDLSAFLSVPAAIEFQRRNRWDEVRPRCHALLRQFLERVQERSGLEAVCGEGDFLQMAVLPVPPMDPDVLKAELFGRFRIEVPVTAHGNRLFVRVSVQAYNTSSDLEALAAALATLYGW